MKHGPERFENYLVQLEALMAQASTEKNAALYLYSHDARTIAFMLEGLSRLYAGMHNKKRFIEIKKSFKSLEDLLGMIDYYDAFVTVFKPDPRVPITVTAYCHEQMNINIAALNAYLVKERWIGKRTNRIRKIRQALKSINWMKPKKETLAIAAFYKSSIEDIKVLGLESEKGFTEIEGEVHELRRALRWLSIYPRALQGVVQLTDTVVEDEGLKKYLTGDIVQSSFNKMPDAAANKRFVLLEKKYFYALSWMISRLGNLKDRGLKLLVLSEALEQTEHLNKATSMKIAAEVLHEGSSPVEDVLKEASEMSHAYFESPYLDGLVKGVARIRP